MAKLLKNIICYLALLSFSAFVVADQSLLPLTPHKAIYKSNIKKGVKLKGTAVRELKQLNDKQWLYRFDVESFAADITESVVLEWDGITLQPQKYDYRLSGFFIKDKYQKVQFDWQNKVAKGKHDGKSWKLNLLDNSLDRLGYQLQLLMDVQRHSLSEAPPSMSYEIVHRGKNRPSQFAIVGPESLATKHGDVDTIKVIKQRAEGKKRETSLWFSKE